MTHVLGIDPGTHRLGWGVISGTPSKQHRVTSGCLESRPGTKSDVYLPYLYDNLVKIIIEHRPHYIGLETLLFQKNVKTAITVAEARGVILLVAAQHHIPVISLAPNSIKSAVGGSGNAAKQEVTRMVGLLLGVDVHQLIDDETDALAIAIATMVINHSL